jgi:DNA-binding NtrC family response regulator
VVVRIISAANVPLSEHVHQGKFREDLYFRLAVLKVNLPPLRDREGDIMVLASHFLNECASKNNLGNLAFSAEALQALHRYHWPGNVRELKNVVERAAIMSSSRAITAKDLEISSCNSTGGYDNASFAAAKHQLLDNFERTYLESLLERNGWNVSRVSQIAGIDRKSIQRLMKKHQLQGATFH